MDIINYTKMNNSCQLYCISWKILIHLLILRKISLIFYFLIRLNLDNRRSVRKTGITPNNNTL